MNKKAVATVGIIGGLALIGFSIYYYIKRQTDLIKNFTYVITGINFTTFNLSLIKGDITIAFTNTSDIEVLVNEFYVDFFFNDEYVGYLEDKTPFVIKNRETTPVTTEFTLNPQIILGNITNIAVFTTQFKDAAFKVSGKARVKSGFISVTVPVEFRTTLRELGYV
jgi:hypothetical protein